MQILVGTVPVALGRTSMAVENHGPDDAWVGDNDVSAATGNLLAVGTGRDIVTDGVMPMKYVVSDGSSDIRTLVL